MAIIPEPEVPETYTGAVVGAVSGAEVSVSEVLPAEVVEEEAGRSLSAKAATKIAKGLSAEQGLEILDILLQKSVPPEKINEVLLSLLSAVDTKMTAKGERYETPNWQARLGGLDRALALKRFTQKSDGSVGEQPVTKITFNVIENVNVNKISDLKDADEKVN